MNTGVITARYAAALLRWVDETGRSKPVCSQVLRLLKDPESSGEPLEPELQSLISLLARNGRTAYLKYILVTFLRMHNEEHHIKMATLTTAAPSKDTEDMVRGLLEGNEVIFDVRTDPSIIGGFVLKVDDMLLDASVSRQLADIRRQFIKKNRRIV